MFAMNFFNEIPRPFKTQYRCYSVSMLPGNERDDLEHGGKIILPPSALDQLTRLNIVYPMLFKLTNTASSRTTHCGVLEFVADEGKVKLKLSKTFDVKFFGFLTQLIYLIVNAMPLYIYQVYIPYWMMQNLTLEEGKFIRVRNIR